MSRQIFNRSVKIDSIDIFYREAGDKKNPSLLLLHGDLPSASLMFKNLMIALSDRYHLVAPDYPGFGFSAFPDRNQFDYSFANIAAYINKFTDIIGLKTFTAYLHDYGCVVGLHISINHPKKIERIIIQDGNAYEEGIGPQWHDTLDYWRNPTPEKKEKVYAFLSEEGIKTQHNGGLPEELLQRVSPELWMLDWELLKRPGNIDMQFELNCDLKKHMEMFPMYQKYFRTYQPPALIIWGKYDIYFSADEAHCYTRDLPNAQIHVLDGGHKVLETHFDEVLNLIDNFLAATNKGRTVRRL